MSIRQRPAQLIDLRKACPTRRLLPAASIAYASRAILTDPFAYSDALLHGPDLGSTPLREEVVAWLSEFYSPDAGPIPPERLCITGGASQNLACILQKFTDPVYTRAVWLVAPTLRISCKIFEDNGLEGKLRVVLEDEEGLDIDSLASLLAIEEEKATSSANVKPVFKSLSNYPKIYKHIIYCMPTFKNPTSKSISLRRRRQLVDLARKYDALVIADDVFDFLRWGKDIENTRPIPRISDIDRDSAGMPDEYGNAVSNGSFSKLLAPGCRVGWLEGTEKFVIELAKAGSTQAEGAPSQLVSMFIWNLLTTGTLQSHLSDILIPVYSRRFECLKHSFDTVLSPLGVHLDNSPAIHGGWFLWLRLPDWCDAKALSEWVEKDYNLLIAYGDMYQLRDYPGSSKDPSRAIRICLAWEEEDQLIEGVRRLAEGIKAMKEFRSPGGPMKIQNMCDA